MTVPSRFLLPLLLALGLLQPQLACTGGGGGGSTPQPVPAPDFTLSVAVGNLNIATGSSGSLMVTANRSNGHSATITLSVDGLPAGITASGTIAAGANSGQLALSVASGVAPQTLQSITVKGTDGVLSHTTAATFTLTVLALQDSSASGTNLVHASGKAQSGQGFQNVALVGEPFAVTGSNYAGTENRTGFTPPPAH